MARDQFGSAQSDWLSRNHRSFVWRLVGPNVRNRFDSNVSEDKLEEYMQDRQLLWEHCSAQCFLEDICILKITDLSFCEYQTDHPNLMGIEQESLRSYLEHNQVWDQMRSDLEELVELCRKELHARRTGSESPIG